MTAFSSDDEWPSAARCAPIGALALRVLADVRQWSSEWLPSFHDLALEGISFGEALISPWCTASMLGPPARMAAWAYAIDSYSELDVTGIAELDELLDRCGAVIRTGATDNAHPLLASLSAWQREFSRLPRYPDLAALWERRFTRCLRATRYDWLTGRARGQDAGFVASTAEYLENADSIFLWAVHLPRWVAYGGDDLTDQLDLLVPALDDATVAVRLANDLATATRERHRPEEDNILLYGVSADWVRSEVANRVASVRRRLSSLLAEGSLPAIGVVRATEWSVGVYAVTDIRRSAQDPANVLETPIVNTTDGVPR